jgi:hypothetical protein
MLSVVVVIFVLTAGEVTQFGDDTMQIVEIEVHTCKILCHVQDIMTEMAKVY